MASKAGTNRSDNQPVDACLIFEGQPPVFDFRLFLVCYAVQGFVQAEASKGQSFLTPIAKSWVYGVEAAILRFGSPTVSMV